LVYVIHDRVHPPYTGATSSLDNEAILKSHRARTRSSTTRLDHSKTRVEFTVRGFPNITAAMRFERVVKKTAAGVTPKLKKAISAVKASRRYRELSVVSEYHEVT